MAKKRKKSRLENGLHAVLGQWKGGEEKEMKGYDRKGGIPRRDKKDQSVAEY